MFSKGSNPDSSCVSFIVVTWDRNVTDNSERESVLCPFVVPNVDLTDLLNVADMLHIDDCAYSGASVRNSHNGRNVSAVVTTHGQLGLIAMKDFESDEFVCSMDAMNGTTHSLRNVPSPSSMRHLSPPSAIFQILVGGLVSICHDDELTNVDSLASGTIGRQGIRTQLSRHEFIASSKRTIVKGTLLRRHSGMNRHLATDDIR